MLILLSPSKTINFKPAASWIHPSQPPFLEQSEKLVSAINMLGKELGKTLDVSDKLADENRQRYKTWNVYPNKDNSGPAAWAYRGETFFGLSAERLDQDSMQFAQEHLLIISGLYGLLRPEDQIMHYRLEMTTKLKGEWGTNLYKFWGNKLAEYASAQSPNFILNCASEAYSKAVLKHLPKNVSVVSPKFLHNGKSKMAFSKYTRGLMARWAIENRVSNPKQCLEFNIEGYKYDPKLSSLNQPVFNALSNFSLKGRWTKL